VEPPKAVTSLMKYFHLESTALNGNVADLPEYVKVCQLSDIPTDSMFPFDLGENHIMIVNVEGTLYAVDRICTHETADLSTGFLTDSEVTCPLHLSRFDVTNGSVQNPPATRPLRTYKLRVEETTVYVQL
jgi:3-phenylpropionate/trans-cinnamate dioxygenase ferredoxin subunit